MRPLGGRLCLKWLRLTLNPVVFKRSAAWTFTQSWSPLRIPAFAKAGLSQTCVTFRLPSQSSLLFSSVPLSFPCPFRRVHQAPSLHLAMVDPIAFVKYSSSLFQSTYNKIWGTFAVDPKRVGWRETGACMYIKLPFNQITLIHSKLNHYVKPEVRIFIELPFNHKVWGTLAVDSASVRLIEGMYIKLPFNQ